MRKLPSYDINIGIAVNGIVVRVGCKTFVSEDVDAGMREITSFIKDEETEFSKKYLALAEDRLAPQQCETANCPPLRQ